MAWKNKGEELSRSTSRPKAKDHSAEYADLEIAGATGRGFATVRARLVMMERHGFESIEAMLNAIDLNPALGQEFDSLFSQFGGT